MNLSTQTNRKSTNNIETATVEGLRLMYDLQDLLEQLLRLARQGDSTNEQFGSLTNKAGSLVDKVKRIGILDVPELRYRHEQIRKQYEGLCLIVAAQKANTSREINQIKRGRKTLETYRKNM
ncbi:MAG: hypothetical protein JXM79_03335 [Sedimentisphaerales bacterium]|nr:hypothetical protein [Sedimentisphaerales bacterium]